MRSKEHMEFALLAFCMAIPEGYWIMRTLFALL
jgi:hypothetical protein